MVLHMRFSAPSLLSKRSYELKGVALELNPSITLGHYNSPFSSSLFEQRLSMYTPSVVYSPNMVHMVFLSNFGADAYFIFADTHREYGAPTSKLGVVEERKKIMDGKEKGNKEWSIDKIESSSYFSLDIAVERTIGALGRETLLHKHIIFFNVSPQFLP